MNIMIINKSGNVGKSTLSKFLLLPRISNAKIISVETSNSGSNVESALPPTSTTYREILSSAMIDGNIIVDIGASCFNDFFDEMKKHSGTHDCFDYFLIPITPFQKQMIDGVSTILDLVKELKVDPNKIKIIFNMVDSKNQDNINTQFQQIKSASELLKFRFNEESVIYSNELYQKLRLIDQDLTIEQIVNSKGDIKQEILNEPDQEKKMALVSKLILKSMAISVKTELDDAYNSLELS